MEHEMLLKARLYFETYSNDEIIAENNPLREYESDVIDGPILDIGCGQSAFLLEYARKGRKVVAFDNEPEQLDLLKQRVMREAHHELKNWDFALGDIAHMSVPDRYYSVIILSHLLHFFSLEQCVEIVDKLTVHTKPGSLIYVKVHSDKHYCNKPDNPERTSYFKHYFAPADLKLLFRDNQFEQIYLAQIDRQSSSETIRFISAWLDVALAYHGHAPEDIEEIKQEYLLDKSESYNEAIFRRL